MKKENKKKNYWTFAVVIVLVLVGVLIYQNRNSEIVDLTDIGPEPFLISPQLAEVAAEDYLLKYSPGNYQNLGYFPAYNLDGEIEAYYFIFVSEEFEFDSFEKIEEMVRTIENEEDRYYYDDVRTIIAGAWTTQRPVDRIFVGLPPFIVKKFDLQETLEENFIFGRLIHLNVIDARYEVAREPDIILGEPLLDESYLMDVKNEELSETAGEARERIKEEIKASNKEIMEMTPETRENHLEGIINLKEMHVAEWRMYQTL